MLDRRLHTIPYLDGWRGLAIIAVLVAHFQHQTLSWLGNFGVQLFFVLLGYLMGGLLFIKEVSLKDFFAKRFSRVLPTFFVFVTVMMVYAATLQPRSYSVPMSEFLSPLVFARTYFPADVSINSGTWPIGHMWSLNVEEHSYIVLGIGALVARNLRRKSVALGFLWLIVLAALFFSVYYPSHIPAGATEWHRRSKAAALGLLASAAYRVTAIHPSFKRLAATTSPACLISLAMALLCYCIYEVHGGTRSPILKYTLAPLFLAYSINHLLHAPEIFRRLLSSKLLCWFGTCSFSLYLWQQPFYYAYVEHGLPLVQALFGALICGTISFYCWESPVRNYLNKKWTPRNKTTLAQKSPVSPPAG